MYPLESKPSALLAPIHESPDVYINLVLHRSTMSTAPEISLTVASFHFVHHVVLKVKH